APLVWGSAFFNPGVFLLNDTTANTQLRLLNGIDLDNTGAAVTRTFTVNSTAAGAIATLMGALTDSNGAASIIKNGNGILALSNSGNNFTGTITIAAGTLQLDAPNVLPAGASINLAGGILGL